MEGSSSLYVTNHPNKFEGCGQCARGDVSYLFSFSRGLTGPCEVVCLVTLFEGSSSMYVTILPDLVTIDIKVVETCFYFMRRRNVITSSKGYVAYG